MGKQLPGRSQEGENVPINMLSERFGSFAVTLCTIVQCALSFLLPAVVNVHE